MIGIWDRYCTIFFGTLLGDSLKQRPYIGLHMVGTCIVVT